MSRIVIQGITALFLLCTAAQAYVPPSFFVIRMLARKHSSLDDGRFKHKITVYHRDGEIFRTFTETLVLTNSETATTQLTDESGAEVATHTRKLLGNKTSEMVRPVPYDLYFLKDGASIYTHFRMLGLPLKTEGDLYAEKEGSLPYKPEDTVAFKRHENRVAVVVGDVHAKTDSDSSSDARTTQLWVEKDSYLPIKAVFPTPPETGNESDPLEFRASGYQHYKNFVYPRVTQVFRRGKLWVRIETQEVHLTAGARPEAKRDIGDLDSDVRKFVEMYFKWVR